MVESTIAYLVLLILGAYFCLALFSVVGSALYDAAHLRQKGPSKKRLPSISVIVVAKNHEAHIRECLRSILGNGYKKIELVIVDNASKDMTKQAIKEVMRSGPKLPIIFVRKRKSNSFTKVAAEAAERANSEIIIPLDGDSSLAPGALRAIAERFRADTNMDTLELNRRAVPSFSLFGLLEQFESLAQPYILKSKAFFRLGMAYEASAIVFVRPLTAPRSFIGRLTKSPVRPLELLGSLALLYIFYVAYMLQDALLLLTSALAFAAWLGFCAWAAEQMRWLEKLRLGFSLPAACMLFVLRSLVASAMYLARPLLRRQ